MKTLEQLIQQLNTKVHAKDQVNIYDLFAPLQNYTQEDWKKVLRMENGQTKNTLLYLDEKLKVILIHWNSFQQSEKHGHPAGGGLIKVLSGTLVESLYDPANPNRLIGKHRYNAGNISFVHDDIAYHAVENPGRMPAVSLHIYSPTIYVPGFAPVNSVFQYQYSRVSVAA